MTTLIITQRRGDTFEGGHPISAVLVRADGTVVERIGDPLVTTMRSAAKPFQLDVSLGLLPAPQQATFSDQELALGAASHSAQSRHIALVRDLLERLRLDVHDIRCGAHWPMHEDSGRQLLTDGVQLTQLHNNCSGKHSFMAAASAAHGWDPDYRDPAHPLQQRIREAMDHYTGGRVTGAVVDGCGVPCWVSSLQGFATAWANLAVAMGQPDSRLGRIGWAMHRQSWYMSGDGRIDHTLVTHAARPLVSKVGAAALLCLALPEEGLGIALKVRSAHNDARAIAIGAVLERWFPGLLPAECLAPWRIVRNVVGKPVGEITAAWS